ncbi:MAG: glycosyltransferase family 2 protein, partial [Actinobacteria bacterium]
NGQFTRLSALQSVGDAPWSDCLTEDLDLGLTLTRNGWRIRFCLSAWVAQQAVLDFKSLFRQRTRWIQGHYQCWTHAPHLARARNVPWATRLDLLIYLFLGCYVWLVAAGPLFGVLAGADLVLVESRFLHTISDESVRTTIKFLLSIAPLSVFIISYQARSLDPFKGRWLPAIAAIFTAYTYTMLLSQTWALWRIATRRDGWAKTARVRSEAAV